METREKVTIEANCRQEEKKKKKKNSYNTKLRFQAKIANRAGPYGPHCRYSRRRGGHSAIVDQKVSLQLKEEEPCTIEKKETTMCSKIFGNLRGGRSPNQTVNSF